MADTYRFDDMRITIGGVEVPGLTSISYSLDEPREPTIRPKSELAGVRGYFFEVHPPPLFPSGGVTFEASWSLPRSSWRRLARAVRSFVPAPSRYPVDAPWHRLRGRGWWRAVRPSCAR